jgi:hypothetical protein
MSLKHISISIDLIKIQYFFKYIEGHHTDEIKYFSNFILYLIYYIIN